MQDPNQGQDKSAQIHRIQQDLVILETDLSKVEREMEDTRFELKRDEHQEESLKIKIDEEKTKLRKLEGEQMTLTSEIGKLRKKMNLLR